LELRDILGLQQHIEYIIHFEDIQLLSQLARKYLSILATSVSSERLFSKAGELISTRRSALAPSTVDKLLFLNKNAKLLIQ